MYAFQKGETPLYRAVWPFIGGIVASILSHQIYYASYGLFGLCLCLLLSYFFLSRRHQKYNYYYVASFLIYTLLFLAGYIMVISHKELNNPRHFSRQTADFLSVTIIESPKIKGNMARFTAEVNHSIKNKRSYPTIGKLLVAMRLDNPKQFPYQYGDQLLIEARFSETEPPYNPAEFNYKRFLGYKQIYHQSFMHLRQSHLLKHDEGNPVLAFAIKLQKILAERFEKHLKFKDSQAVAATLILGFRANLDEAIVQSYSKTGTMHVLSVSGMHVAILAGILRVLLSFLSKVRGGTLIRLVLMLGTIWTYWLVTGAAPSITRAAIMLSLVLIAQVCSHRINTLNVLAFSAFIILIYNPFSIMDIGFQLSFLAVLGLIELQPKLYKAIYFRNKLADKVWNIMSVSIAAQAATFIISIYYFHQFPLYFIVSNLFITVPAILMMALGFAFLTLGTLSTLLAEVFGFLLNYCIYYTNRGLLLIENLPSSSINQIWLSNLEIGLLLIAFLLMVLKPKHFLLKTALLLISMMSVHSYHTFGHMRQQKLIFFSLRKNQAVAILDGRRAFIMTDLDSLSSAYQFSVKPYLDSCRVQHVTIIRPHLNQTNMTVRFKSISINFVNNKMDKSGSRSDFVCLAGIKDLDVNEFLKVSVARRYFIDARAKEYVAEKLIESFAQHHKELYFLKRKPAEEINLKQL